MSPSHSYALQSLHDPTERGKLVNWLIAKHDKGDSISLQEWRRLIREAKTRVSQPVVRVGPKRKSLENRIGAEQRRARNRTPTKREPPEEVVSLINEINGLMASRGETFADAARSIPMNYQQFYELMNKTKGIPGLITLANVKRYLKQRPGEFR